MSDIIFHTLFAPLEAWFFLLFSVVLALLLFFRYKSFFQDLFSRLTTRMLVLFSALLMCVYFVIFITINHYPNTVPLSGDSWEYQVMGVNLSKGHGIQRLSLLEPFNTYMFNTEEVDDETYQNLQMSPYYVVDIYRTPAYSIFLGLIYKIFGIHPSVVKIIQLLLLCFVAGFLGLLFYRIWHIKGLLAGIAGGFIFILKYNYLSQDIMTEVLLIFFSFLIVWVAIIFEQRRNIFVGCLLGIIFGLALLTKGMLIFVIGFYLIYQLIHFFRTKEKRIRKSIAALYVAFIFCVLPWTIYASYVNKFMLIEAISKEQIITATSNVEAIFETRVIDNNNIITVIEEITDIYYENNYWNKTRCSFVKDYIKKYPGILKNTYSQVIEHVKKEINQFYQEHLNYTALPWFSKKHLYINFKGFTLLSIQPRTLLLESNNEHCTDGGWHQEARHNTYYYKTDNPNSSSWVRILKFYYNNPKLIFKIFPTKFHAGFKNFFFIHIFLLFSFLSILKNSKSYLLIALLIGFPLLLLLLRMYPPMLFILSCLWLCLIIWLQIRRLPLFPVSIPPIIKFFFINIFLITFIFYGLDRFTLITEFLFIPVTLLVLGVSVKEMFG